MKRINIFLRSIGYLAAALVLSVGLSSGAAGQASTAGSVRPNARTAAGSTLSTPSPQASAITQSPSEPHRHRKIYAWIAIAAGGTVTAILLWRHYHRMRPCDYNGCAILGIAPPGSGGGR